jgi:alkaline phosphatase
MPASTLSGPSKTGLCRTMPLRILPVFLLLLAAPVWARNVILFIGDGMDDHQITIARNYLLGATGRLQLDRMPLRAAVQVLTVDEQGRAVYVADSANSATSMATGAITSRGRIATAAGSGEPLHTLLEMAEAHGLKTGLVTTSSVTDATPAAFVAHISMRTCENPEAIHGSDKYGIETPACPAFLKARGGPGSISEQIAESSVDVVLGGGLKHFEQTAEGSGQSVLELASAGGFRVVRTASELAAAPVTERVLGLFADSHLPVRLRGENGREAESPRPSWANQLHRYLGRVDLPPPMRCEPNPEFSRVPSLQSMTTAALQRLENEAGFFLMVESASIDKQSHERLPCGSIGEVQQLDEAVTAALDFAARHPDTLILVTADHGHAAQLVPSVSLFASYGVPVFTPGKLARLRTDEGAILAVNYATNNFPYEEHTGVNVPLFANRAGAGEIPSMVTQPEIFTIMKNYLFAPGPAAGDPAAGHPAIKHGPEE